ncbi:hypothetical protein G6Z92_04855 [Vibrio aestuarianus subsp. cardii]|uniref:hypothetical protein n=1 Tax=Vibrio aestuarianus TaxID=28171 RepID=UPI0015C54ED4|nr:hypothetical protein [Vibrio aestuarianus]NGZ66316.1 hypothetical protein [Vibrio aestuarianus subsp. cardii]
MQVSQPLNARLVDLGFVVIGGVIIWMITQSIAGKIDTATKQATKGAGQALSDFFAAYNGWEPITLKPLMIRDFYLTADKKLTPDAESTLWKISEYRPLLFELFGYQGGALKPQYYDLTNVEITRRNLQ